MPGFERAFDYLPNTTDWYGRWRLKGRPENDWLIDREAQTTGGNYTGIAGIHAQDQAVTESMGPITDHLFEHLGAQRPDDHGDPPPAVGDGAGLGQARHGAAGGRRARTIMYPVRSGDFVTEARLGWREAYDREMRAAVRPLKMAAE